MQLLKNYLAHIYESRNIPTSLPRRLDLINEMKSLEGKTIHCFSCPGTCCTSQANSMQITPIEALEILAGLNSDEWTDEVRLEFIKRMEQNILDYRLNVEIYTGKKNTSALRKTYTCPFFNNGSLGCGLSRSVKPYGCLGFNPKASDDNGKTCASNSELLSVREETFKSSEDHTNQFISDDLKLSWKKLSIPQALIDILNRKIPDQFNKA